MVTCVPEGIWASTCAPVEAEARRLTLPVPSEVLTVAVALPEETVSDG